MLVTAEAFLNDSLSRTSSPHRPSISSHRRARGGSSEPHSAPGCARAAPGAGPLRRRRRAAPWQGRNEFGAQRLSEFARHLAHEAAPRRRCRRRWTPTGARGARRWHGSRPSAAGHPSAPDSPILTKPTKAYGVRLGMPRVARSPQRTWPHSCPGPQSSCPCGGPGCNGRRCSSRGTWASLAWLGMPWPSFFTRRPSGAALPLGTPAFASPLACCRRAWPRNHSPVATPQRPP